MARPPAERVQAHENPSWQQMRPTLAAISAHAMLIDASGAIVDTVGTIGGHGTLVACLATEDRDTVLAGFRHALRPGIAQFIRARCTDQAGEKRWYDWRMVPAGKHVIAVLHDVDALRREHGHLQEQVQLIRDSERMARMGTWYWDITQPHAEWTPSLYEIYGLNPAKHTPTYEDYLRRVHPEDVDRVKQATEAAFNELKPYSHDERIKHTDGDWRVLHTWARPVLGDAGQLVALQGVCWDVTERVATEKSARENEARLQAVFEGSAVGFAVLDSGGRILESNPALDALFGEPLERTNLTAFVRRGDQTPLAALLADPENQPETGMEAQLRNGKWVRIRINAAANDEQELRLAIIEDVTVGVVARQRQEEIEKLQRESEQQKALLNVAAHELKNPLTPLLLRLHLLSTDRLGPLEPKQKEAVQKIEAQAQRLEGLVADLLDVGRLGAGMRCDVRPTHLQNLANTVASALHAQAKQWDVQIEVDVPESARVMADAPRLERVLWNLIGNALKFSPAGSTVRVHAAQAKGKWRLGIEDEGPGLDKEALEHVFEAYWHGPSPEPGRPASTGLGLYISKGLVQAQGGKIGVENREEGGARFWVQLTDALSGDS